MKIEKVDKMPEKRTVFAKKLSPVGQAVDAMEVGEVLVLAADNEEEFKKARNAVYNLDQRTKTKKFRTLKDGNRLYVQRIQ